MKIEPVAWMYHWPEDPGRTPWLVTEVMGPTANGWQHGWTETPLFAHPAQHDAVALKAEVAMLRQLLHDVRLEAGETIPPDGKAAAFGALHTIVRMITDRAALSKGPNNESR